MSQILSMLSVTLRCHRLHMQGYLLLTENTPVTMRGDRERLTQLLFESFNLKGMYLLDSGVAASYAGGSTSGIVVDIGLTGTNVTQVRNDRSCSQCNQSLQASPETPLLPSYVYEHLHVAALCMLGSKSGLVADQQLCIVQVTEGLIPPGGQQRLPLSGAKQDELLDGLLRKRGVNLKRSNVEALKEKCAAVAETAAQFDEVISGAGGSMDAEAEYDLPDGTKVSIQSEGYALLLQACDAEPV